MATHKIHAVAPANPEFDFHVLKHGNKNGDPSYTIGVWEGQSLRAICHLKPLSSALLAVASELGEQNDTPAVEFRRWSEVADLVDRLKQRADTDCLAAAGYIEDFISQLHKTTVDLAWVSARLQQMGTLLEEAAAKASTLGQSEEACKILAIPQNLWFKLLAVYRCKQEGNELFRELQLLRELAGIAAETLTTVDDWLGHASTREAAMDALWRFRRILEGAGYPLPLEHLAFRGQAVRAMEEAGVGVGIDGVLRLRRPQDRNWQPASGIPVKDALEAAIQRTI